MPASCRVSGSKDQMLGLGEFNSIVLSYAKDSSNWGVLPVACIYLEEVGIVNRSLQDKYGIK